MSNSRKDDEAPPEYDLGKLGKGVRGKYFKRFQESTNVVVIDPELTAAFPNAKAVNDALREVLARRKRNEA
jgi:hypothetical protein